MQFIPRSTLNRNGIIGVLEQCMPLQPLHPAQKDYHMFRAFELLQKILK